MESVKVCFPGWTIVRLIGIGSFGQVYEIKREDGSASAALKVISIPGSDEEIKILRDEGYDDNALAALFRARVADITEECRLTNCLKGCGNIVDYEDYQIVPHEDDPGYDVLIRMELLTPLTEYVRRLSKGSKFLLDKTACRIGIDICTALERCRTRQIIHRDIKPKNIFIDEQGNFKLGDFGVAKTSDRAEKVPKMGTFNFMAPEMYRSEPYDASVDLYSLGLTLYWALNDCTGPFLPLSPAPTSDKYAAALERRMLGEPLPAPKHGSEALKRIVLKACAFDPRERYAAPTEMKRDLECLFAAADDEQPGNNSPFDTEWKREPIETSIGMPMPSAFEDTNAPRPAQREPREWLADDCDRCVYAPPSPAPSASYDDMTSRPREMGRPRPDPFFDTVPGTASSASSACPVCGGKLFPGIRFCPCCGTPVAVEEPVDLPFKDDRCGAGSPAEEKPTVSLSKVEFSAIAPKTLVKDEYSIISIAMYEPQFRSVVNDLIKAADEPVQEARSGVVEVQKGAEVKIVLSSPDVEIEDDTETGIWQGEHLEFSFAVLVPADFKKRQILFVATAYVNDVIAVKLKFIVKCNSFFRQKIAMTREDVVSAFVSYASEDRSRVATIVQGMRAARPDLDIFFDVESLRSGDVWEQVLHDEIEKRDVLFLCWSHAARNSEWVEKEWRYALEKKGADSIEPLPIESPAQCPPPEELKYKHWNDRLLYIINS